jgi:hypothetical protein
MGFGIAAGGASKNGTQTSLAGCGPLLLRLRMAPVFAKRRGAALTVRVGRRREGVTLAVRVGRPREGTILAVRVGRPRVLERTPGNDVLMPGGVRTASTQRDAGVIGEMLGEAGRPNRASSSSTA